MHPALPPRFTLRTPEMSMRRYYQAYGNWWKIQREMLADRPRMQGYVNAIEAHADAIRGKVVIDVGAGTVTARVLTLNPFESAAVIELA